MLIKKYAETATRNTRETPKIVRTQYKRLTHKLHLFIGMDFIQTRVFTPLLPWDPSTELGKLAKKKRKIGKLGKNTKRGRQKKKLAKRDKKIELKKTGAKITTNLDTT